MDGYESNPYAFYRAYRSQAASRSIPIFFSVDDEELNVSHCSSASSDSTDSNDDNEDLEVLVDGKPNDPFFQTNDDFSVLFRVLYHIEVNLNRRLKNRIARCRQRNGKCIMLLNKNLEEPAMKKISYFDDIFKLSQDEVDYYLDFYQIYDCGTSLKSKRNRLVLFLTIQ